ncbi:MAG: sterol desaturase family protein, partial [Bacteroidota bacterium]|nr:sterol desaturase family protein [Bacteroidota bacterium]
KHGHGRVIETFGVVSKSKPLVDKAVSLRASYHKLFPEEVRDLISNLYGNIALYLVVPFLLLLEFLFPCNPSQPLISKGFVQDAIWYILDTPLLIFILYPVVGFFHGLFNQYLGFLILHKAAVWPAYLQIIAALLLADLFIWFNHFARHKIRTLWFFHAIHHSQKEMNVFTDERGHIVDLLVVALLGFIPFFIFDVSNLYAVIVIGIYKPIHNRFLHANLKINLGWLGLLITSPQFHRVHHSADPAHFDKNYGGYLSIYDYLFGTACASRHVYPETGIADPQFPTEDKVRLSQLPKNWLIQTVYPFVQVFKQVQASRQLKVLRLRRHSGVERSTANAKEIGRHRKSQTLYSGKKKETAESL